MNVLLKYHHGMNGMPNRRRYMKALMNDPLRIALTYKGVYARRQISKVEYSELLKNLSFEATTKEIKDQINTLLAELRSSA